MSIYNIIVLFSLAVAVAMVPTYAVVYSEIRLMVVSRQGRYRPINYVTVINGFGILHSSLSHFLLF